MRVLRKRGQGGFTLVEMAVVLVIIGVILGAVMIGRDVQRNAEYTRIKQKFMDQWVVAYNTYNQRLGAPVGDDQSAPRLMVNGANYDGDGNVLSGGDMSGASAPSAICRGQKARNMLRDMQGGEQFDLRDMMRRAGITMPPGRGDGFEDRYVYLDTNGNPQEIQVCFQWNPPGTVSGSGNVMVISGLTPDLARALDQMVDGKPDAQNGAFRQEGLNSRTTGDATSPGVEWLGNNTQDINAGSTGEALTDGGNTDTEQVMTLVAHYKMNQ
ncbi:type II secretion system protein [Coralloluteibacterium stylophorae]|uniref:Prepilin-type N-terminal cleavage/methylation domain-containing protein n=1 Tax=Coralloluteibacterium stylophorae TaxID=1776034 RepID=A0A8J7VSY7_9GAMM|nr:prepilin-type N-terminal cleavage/methylation domain-containing protein [Coralloluteibacterium stylophorae]MBS7456790.1 prepilin-type N-terminal cleavage/methylation domain-containing protein [Coralloluteibacterium stylophorae]